MSADHPVTRDEMQASVNAAEDRSQDLIAYTVTHFDQRLRDTERVLTWRMVAVGGMTGVLTSALDVLARGGDSAAVAVLDRFFF